MVAARHRSSALPADGNGERGPSPGGCSERADLGECRPALLRPRVADAPVRSPRSERGIARSARLDQQRAHELLLPGRRARGTPGVRHRRVQRAPQNHPPGPGGTRRDALRRRALPGVQRRPALRRRLGHGDVDGHGLCPRLARSPRPVRSRAIAGLHPHAHGRRRHRRPRGDRHRLHPPPDDRPALHRDRTHGTCGLRRVPPGPLRPALLRARPRPAGSRSSSPVSTRSSSGSPQA